MYKGNIQPRLGLAWSPGKDHRTAVLSSLGIYSVPLSSKIDFCSKPAVDFKEHTLPFPRLTAVPLAVPF